MIEEVERLVAGEAWQYRLGSRSRLEPTQEDQVKTLYELCDRMSNLTPVVAKLGEHIFASPVPSIETLFNLRNGEK